MIHVFQDEQQLGPFSEEELQQMVASGSVRVNALGWKDGMAEWQPLSKVVDLSDFPPPLPLLRLSVPSDQSASKGDRAQKQGWRAKPLILVLVVGVIAVGALPVLGILVPGVASVFFHGPKPLKITEAPLLVDPRSDTDSALVFFRYVDSFLALPNLMTKDGQLDEAAADAYAEKLRLAEEYVAQSGLDREFLSILEDKEQLLTEYKAGIRQYLAAAGEHELRTTKEVSQSSFRSGFEGGKTAAQAANNGADLLGSALVGLGVYAANMWFEELENAPIRNQVFADEVQEIEARIKEATSAAESRFSAAAKALSLRHKWGPNDDGTSVPRAHREQKEIAEQTGDHGKLLTLLRSESDSRPSDPFARLSWAFMRWGTMDKVTDAAALGGIEKEALEALALLPSDGFYDSVRAAGYWLAGRCALAQTQLAAGEKGYGDGPFDSSRAIRLLLAARKYDPYDADGHARYCLGLAYATAGHLQKAIALLDEVAGTFASDGHFYAGLSQVYAAAGQGDGAISALRRAVCDLGYADINALRQSSDLRSLRDEHAKAFDEITSIRTAADIDLGFWSDEILRNDSAFPLTNVRFTPTIVQSGKTFTKELRAERIAPGEVFKWSGELGISGSGFDSYHYTVKCDQGSISGQVEKR